MALKDVTNKIPGHLRRNLLENEVAYHFAFTDTKGGCLSKKSAKSYVLISNNRVIYDASVKEGESYVQSNGSIPINKVSFVGTSSAESKEGCSKVKIHLLKISSGGGTIELRVPTETEAKRLQRVISEVQSNNSSV
jgi:hypothetical protein